MWWSCTCIRKKQANFRFMCNCKGGALYSLNSVWPIFHLSSSFKRKMMLCLLLIKKEDNKCIVVFQFFPARLSTYSGLLSRSDKGIKQIHFWNKRIRGEEMNSNYLDFTDLCKMNRRWKQPNKQYQWLHGIQSRMIYIFSLIFTKPLPALLSIFLNTKKSHLNNYAFHVHCKIRQISAFKVWERIHCDYKHWREDSQHCKWQTILTYYNTRILLGRYNKNTGANSQQICT